VGSAHNLFSNIILESASRVDRKSSVMIVLSGNFILFERTYTSIRNEKM
jgi:hypothetical protein